MDRGVFVSRKEAEETTLFEALDRFIEDYIPRLKTAANETRRAKGIQRREIDSLYMAAIRSKHIADFIKKREAEGVKPNTIRLDLAILSRLFEKGDLDTMEIAEITGHKTLQMLKRYTHLKAERLA